MILMIAALCVIALISVIGFLYWSDKVVMLTEYSVKINKDLKGRELVIAHVSDLQSQYFGREQHRVIHTVEKISPDVILFTGDLMDRNHTDYEAADIVISALAKIAPVFYVNGNHEMDLPKAEIEAMFQRMERQGVNLALDKSIKAICKNGIGLNVMGISERTLYSSKFPLKETCDRFDSSPIASMAAKLVSTANFDDINVIIAHEPQYFKWYERENVDLVFTGHAHGGQIRLFGRGLFSPGQGTFPKYTSGIHKGRYSQMIISRGLGNSTFPFRVFNRPEIVSVKIAGR